MKTLSVSQRGARGAHLAIAAVCAAGALLLLVASLPLLAAALALACACDRLRRPIETIAPIAEPIAAAAETIPDSDSPLEPARETAPAMGPAAFPAAACPAAIDASSSSGCYAASSEECFLAGLLAARGDALHSIFIFARRPDGGLAFGLVPDGDLELSEPSAEILR